MPWEYIEMGHTEQVKKDFVKELISQLNFKDK